MNVLSEVFDLVRWLLPESVCRLCGYDNPYMDDVPDYVCRQCKTRADKWGSGPEAKPLDAPKNAPKKAPWRETFESQVHRAKAYLKQGDLRNARDCLAYAVMLDPMHEHEPLVQRVIFSMKAKTLAPTAKLLAWLNAVPTDDSVYD